MSTDLVYTLGVFFETEELVELCSVLSDYNGIYASHIRSDTGVFLKAVEEVIEIAEKNSIPEQIHHVKVRKRNSLKKIIEEFFNSINRAKERGVDITMDIYPYNASWLGLDAPDFTPVGTKRGGNDNVLKRLYDKNLVSKIKIDTSRLKNWNSDKDIVEESKNIIIVSAPGKKELIDKLLFDTSKMFNTEPIKTDIEIIKMTRVELYISLKEEDIKWFFKCPYTMIGSDAIPNKLKWSVHPRNYGTFPRILGKYMREEKLLSVKEAIHKMTGLSATGFRFDDRDLLKEGLKTDIVVFDENEVIDRANYLEPFNTSNGIEYVIVNDCISV